MEEKTRYISVQLVLMTDGRRLAEFYEGETGYFARYELEEDAEGEFSENVGRELAEWFEIMQEERQREEAQA